MDFWIRTQKVLQSGGHPLVKRPKLTEALLKRPPFRFLHDIISEVCRQTGYAQGLFSEEELTSTNLKEKDAKIVYLLKVINCIGITLNAYVPSRPLKILAGMEPENTNTFLQMLAAAATVDCYTSQNAVTRCLSGESMPAPEHGHDDSEQWLKGSAIARPPHDATSSALKSAQLASEAATSSGKKVSSKMQKKSLDSVTCEAETFSESTPSKVGHVKKIVELHLDKSDDIPQPSAVIATKGAKHFQSQVHSPPEELRFVKDPPFVDVLAENACTRSRCSTSSSAVNSAEGKESDTSSFTCESPFAKVDDGPNCGHILSAEKMASGKILSINYNTKAEQVRSATLHVADSSSREHECSVRESNIKDMIVLSQSLGSPAQATMGALSLSISTGH